MTEWLSIVLTGGIIFFIVLVIWSKVQGDSIVDIMRDIIDLIKEQ